MGAISSCREGSSQRTRHSTTMVIIHRLSSVLLLLLLASAMSRARDSIAPGEPLSGNETLVSAGGGGFVLGFFTPQGSNDTYVGVWYARVSPRTVVWVANRADPVHGPVEDNAGATLSVSRGCELAVADANSTVVWSVSPPAPVAGPCTARIGDDGNLVVSDARRRVAWQGFDHLTDTMLPGMRIGVDFAAGKNMTLTAWKSPSDPSPSPVVVAMDTSGDPEVSIWNGPAKVWRSGPWDGVQFTGVPDTVTYSNFTFSFVNSAREVTYSFQVRNASILSRLVLNSSGSGAGGGLLQRWTWVEAAGAWNLYWYAPKDQCDAVSPCGPNGVCDTNSLPVCSCLRGFAPRSPAAWALRDGRDGCERVTPLDCANATDGFAVVRHAKVPDTTTATVDYDAGLQLCRQRCLRNCSCTAYANANLSAPPGHRGCVMWTGGLDDLRVYPAFGQDLYVRLAAADLDSTSKSKKKTHIIIAVVVSICALAILLALTGMYIWRTKKIKARRRRGPSNWSGGLHSRELHSEGNSHGDDLDLPLFDLETIAAATQDFSTDNKLGEGGFGPVYKGKLEDGQEIAVKALSKTSVQGLDEFRNEVMLIAKLQHRNLVRLIGYSICGQEKMLIYEFMENKSLDYFLFDKSKSMLLDWQTRYRIIEGIARGLLYLHQDSRYRIIHRDLKTSNILLDKEMTPKISDFGMARMFGSDDVEINTIRVVGTYGYMAPEYAMDGVFSVKSDVFSFGVIVLEIISCKRNRGVYSYSSHLNLLAHAWSLWNEENSLDLVDETLDGSFNAEEVLKCLKVGLLCVQENPEDRPLMSQVLLMLASADAASLPDPKQPGFIARRAATEDTSSSKPDCSFVDSMTITMIEGR